MSDESPRVEARRRRDAPQAELHPELVEAAAREAERDASNVAGVLHELGFVPTADHPVHFPAGFLLHLGAALRLLGWEARGLRFHREVGLPPAERATRDAFNRLANHPEADHPDDLARHVVTLAATRLAWHAPRELDAEILLDDQVDEDALLDALARLLWHARHIRKPMREAADE